MNKVILVSASWIGHNTKIIQRYNSLSKTFEQIKFEYYDADDDKEQIKDLNLSIVPSWLLYINGQEKKFEGDILIKPLKHIIRAMEKTNGNKENC